MGCRVSRRRRGGFLFFLVFLVMMVLLVTKGVSFIGEKEADTSHGWALVLVNKIYAVPYDWQVETVTLTNGECVDSRIYSALEAMFDAARAQGLAPEVTSGYRTAKMQCKLIREKKAALRENGLTRRQANVEAERWVAAVGHSEHETGLAVDINDARGQSSQALYDWLATNAWRYGFIERYPASHHSCTKTAHEPWHYRYVGQTAAAAIWQNGLCLEEYIAQLDG